MSVLWTFVNNARLSNIYNLKFIINKLLTLCINTAGHLNTLALVKNGQCLAEENWQSDRNETETVLPKLEKLLTNAHLKIEDVQALNVVQGVGGFTSLRVGISIANTIAFVQKIPLYATSVFELWANRAGTKEEVAILIDAGREECFYFASPLRGRLRGVSKKPLDKLALNAKSQNGVNCLDTPPNLPLRGGIEQTDKDYFSPQIIPNAQLAELKEKFWVGEINEKQKMLLPVETRLIASLQTPGKAFAEIDLQNKKAFQVLEPWYGRGPNVSEPKKGTQKV